MKCRRCLGHFNFVSVHYIRLVTSPLLNIFLASGLAAKDPFGFAVYICLVLNSDSAEMAEDVLHVGIGVAASITAEVIDRLHADENVVNHGNDDNNANGVTPDDNNGDDRCLLAVVVSAKRVLRISGEFVGGSA